MVTRKSFTAGMSQLSAATATMKSRDLEKIVSSMYSFRNGAVTPRYELAGDAVQHLSVEQIDDYLLTIQARRPPTQQPTRLQTIGDEEAKNPRNAVKTERYHINKR
jgi:hypothetical protein